MSDRWAREWGGDIILAMRIRMRAATVCVVGVSAVWWGVCGCGGRGGRDSLYSGNPLDRAHAAVSAAEAGDSGAVHKLVGLLDDLDDAVRMYSIMALRRLCGEDYGYRYYASPVERSIAVGRWQDALRKGEVVVRRSGGAGAGERPRAEGQGR